MAGRLSDDARVTVRKLLADNGVPGDKHARSRCEVGGLTQSAALELPSRSRTRLATRMNSGRSMVSA